MPTIPLNVILFWPKTNATIPSGWQRETGYEGRFIKGTADGVAPNVTGGSDTHSHTSPVHTHTMVHHTHTGLVGRSNGDYETHGGENINAASRDAHEHSYTTDSTQNGSLSDAISYLSTSSNPPYTELIFVKPSSVPAQLADDMVALFGAGNIPTNWAVCDGNNDTLNLDDKYLRGAAAGQDAGATGGTLNHAHTVTHTHTTTNHQHQASGVGQSSDGGRNRGSSPGGGGVVDRNHSHVVYLNSASDTPGAYTDTAGSGDTVEPLYKKLRAIKNNSGAPSKPRGIIALWLGALADIPAGWFLCDGNNGTEDMRGYHLKITTTEGEVGDTGGSNTHVHAASNSHTHTATGTHTHTGYTSGGGYLYGTSADPDGAAKDHSHSFLQSIDAKTSTWNATTISADITNGEPAYRTAAFIMFKYETYGGAAVIAALSSL